MTNGAPNGPKAREWGKPQGNQDSHAGASKPQAFGKGAQGYSKPVSFVKSEDVSSDRDSISHNKQKTDEELEAERKEHRRQEEELSYKDVCILFYFSV